MTDSTRLPDEIASRNAMRPPLDAARSPFARLRPLPFSAVRLRGGFWAKRRGVNRERTLPHGHAMLVESGVFRNFERAQRGAPGSAPDRDGGPSAARSEAGYEGKRYADSDLYKWLEAASYEVGNARLEGGRPGGGAGDLERQVRDAVRLIEETQDATGYLYTYYQALRPPEERWQRVDEDHELYCAGHLFQAAVAHLRCTGESALAEVARRLADLLCAALGPGLNEGLPVHPGIEMALVELYRAFGDERYLALARHLVESRGRGRIGGRVYNQDHLPIREAREIAGHAVMQLYLLSGATDLYLESGDPELLAALSALWDDLVGNKMGINGGVGARYEMESFGEPYELPNDRCYNETCAQIAAVMWAWRMLLATGEARYADYIEWTLYNGVLPGVSLDGRSFFYPNPLLSRGKVERSRWFDCACCPPNVMRTLSSLHTYFATTSDRECQLHLYDSGSLDVSLADGSKIGLSIETRYPWEGEVRIVVDSVEAGSSGSGDLSLSLRIPRWCRSASITVNGEPAGAGAVPGSYCPIRRSWRSGDVVRLRLEMEPAIYVAHPRVEAARGAVALARGPILYCFEDQDQPEGASVLDAALFAGSKIEASWQEGLLDGVVVLAARGTHLPGQPSEPLYRLASRDAGGDPPPSIDLIAVPEFAWANRGPGAMRVWMPVTAREE